MLTILIILGLMALLIGLLGTVYPAIPGLGLMFAGAWLLAYAGDYQIIGTGTLVFLGVVAAVGTAMDYIAGMLGAKFTGCQQNRALGRFNRRHRRRFLLAARPVARPFARRRHRRILGA